ncbi:hypothetical protein D3C80_1458520 [compost metagenome]
MGAGDPGSTGDARVNRRAPGNFGLRIDAAVELGAEDRAADKALAHLHQSLGLHHRHACRAAGAGGGAVDLARLNHHRVGPGRDAVLMHDGGSDLAEGDVRPFRVQRMDEAQLLVGCPGDFQPDRHQVGRLVRRDGKAQALGVGDHETVAAVRGVDLQ